MKVLMVNNFAPTSLGGAEQVIRDLSNALTKTGNSVEHIYTMPTDCKYKNIEAALEVFNPDVVHCHNIDSRTADLVLLAFKRIPTVITLHDYKSICYATLRLFLGKPCTECDNRCGRANESKEKFAPLWDSNIIKVTGSYKAAEIFKTEFDARVIYPAIDLPSEIVPNEAREGVLFTAAYNHYWWKGNAIFRRVAAGLPTIELYSVSRSKVLREMSKAAVYVHPGVYPETFGYCVHPDTIIDTLNGNQPIKKINKGDYVLSADGLYHEVLSTKKRNADHGLLKIIVSGLRIPTLVTPEHKCLVMRRKGRKFLTAPSWTEAKDIKIDDVLLYPILQEEKKLPPVVDLKEYWPNAVDVPNGKIASYTAQTKAIKGAHVFRYIPINSKLFRLIGYYLAEGWTSVKQCVTSFGIHQDEIALKEDIDALVLELFGLPTQTRSRKNSKGIEVSVCSHGIASFFSLFGSGAYNKSVPSMFWPLPINLAKELLKGAWRGDRTLTPSGKACFSYSTVSPTLANQLKHIILRLGFTPTIALYKEKTGHNLINGKPIIGRHPVYTLRVGGSQMSRFADIVGGVCHNRTAQRKALVSGYTDNNFMYSVIRKIEVLPYTGEVIDLEVKDCHSFVSQSMLLHNTAAEAQAMGCPVVAFNVGGLSDIVVNEQTGYLIEPFNEADMQDKIRTLLENKEMARRFGHNGSIIAKHKFSVENMLTNYVKAYNDAISNVKVQ